MVESEGSWEEFGGGEDVDEPDSKKRRTTAGKSPKGKSRASPAEEEQKPPSRLLT